MKTYAFHCKKDNALIKSVSISSSTWQTSMKIACLDDNAFRRIINLLNTEKLSWLECDYINSQLTIRGVLYKIANNQRNYVADNLFLTTLQILIQNNIAPKFLTKIMHNFPYDNDFLNLETPVVNMTPSITKQSMFSEVSAKNKLPTSEAADGFERNELPTFEEADDFERVEISDATAPAEENDQNDVSAEPSFVSRCSIS